MADSIYSHPADSIYSHPAAAPRNRDEQAAKARAALAHYFRSPYGGYPTDNRRAQSDAFRADVYLGIQAINSAIEGVTAQITRFRGSGDLGHNKAFQTKALPTPHAHANDEQRRPVLRGPLVKLFERPNRRETLAKFLAKVNIQDRLTGNVLIWGNPDAAGRVREMFVLPTALCQWQPVYTSEYPIGAWRVMPAYASGWAMPAPLAGAAGALVPAHHVYHVRRPHPYYHWDGYSPLTAASRWVDLIEAIDGACWAAMDEGVTLGPLVSMPGMSQQEADALNEKVRRDKAGYRNHRKPWFVGVENPEAKMTVEPPESPKDMEFREGRQQYAALVLALLGVPPAVAGVKPTTSYSELYAAQRQFRDLSLCPWLAALSAELTIGPLATWDDGNDDLKLQLDLPPLMNEEQAEATKSRQQANGLVTYNEARRADNLPPVKDPAADALPVTLYLQKLGQKLAPPPSPETQVSGDEPAAGGVPKPENKAGKGSLPPQAKAFDLLAGVASWRARRGIA